MKNSNNRKRKTLSFAGAGLALGAAFGILIGMLLFDNPWYGPVIGAFAGLIIVFIVGLSRK
jgi:uncharacterized membrane protein